MPITITAKREGHRRCNMRHPAKPTVHADDAFTDEQLEALRADPSLIVTDSDEGATASEKAAKEAAEKEAKEKAAKEAAEKAAAEKEAAKEAAAKEAAEKEAKEKAAKEAAEKAAAEKEATDEAVKTKPEGEALTAAIVAAIPGLDKDKDFTASGAPKVKSMETALGYDVTADDVATAWEKYQKDNA